MSKSIEDAIEDLMVACLEADPACKTLTIKMQQSTYDKFNQQFIPNIPGMPQREFKLTQVVTSPGDVNIEIL